MEYMKIRILMILFVYILEGTFAICRKRCRIQYPQTCPQGFNCMKTEKEDKTLYHCHEICKYTNTGLVPDDKHCARYYDCADKSVQTGLQVPYLRECFPFQLFDTNTDKCVNYNEVSCNRRFEPKNRCDYQWYRDQERISKSCHFVYKKTDCSECEWPGCGNMPNGWNRIPNIKHLTVFCLDGRDDTYNGCDIGYEPAELTEKTYCIPSS
ncbi:uncharacterized protein LOC123538567 isoform X2 [Mercenaria mercenaria]|uniref:uncharacterized protein LOC123538567 isoform X2 n=1 Tax=Mercenaria mercenaria TaxID=6596 RepID=UPI00234F1DC0|nr:uncharacterized protein LOC123538567 isoform X2 [Mercenaria mercenaria]